MADTSRESSMAPTVLLLGTYHLANNNRDMFNVRFDDMLAPRRQQEMGHCVDQLRRFQPTKVAIEKPTEQTNSLNDDYRRYRSGAFALTANEVHQLGFRTAAAMGHEQIYAIDWNGPIDWEQAFTFAQEHQAALYDQMLAPLDQRTQAINRLVERLSVGELLLKANDPVVLAEITGCM